MPVDYDLLELHIEILVMGIVIQQLDRENWSGNSCNHPNKKRHLSTGLPDEQV